MKPFAFALLCLLCACKSDCSTLVRYVTLHHADEYGPPAPFVDLTKCLDGTATSETDFKVVIGTYANATGENGNCIILIGDGTKVPNGASFFFNIGNKICGDLRTGKRLPCPK
jgi:hypothetical protein